MNLTSITNFTINCVCFLVLSVTAWSQNDSISNTSQDAGTLKLADPVQNTDSIKPFKETYGLRVGVDLSKLIRPFFEDDYKGFEVMGDYRLTEKWYLAGEIGAEDKRTMENDYLDITTQGTYFKAGVDWNAYENWVGMENMIYVGFRVGASSFKHIRNSYGVYSVDQYWAPQFREEESTEFSGLSAIWGEAVVGLKVELLNHLYLGANIQFKYIVSQDQPEGFENVYIPGYQRTYDSSDFGFGYSYGLSYMIPIFKKAKKQKEEIKEAEEQS